MKRTMCACLLLAAASLIAQQGPSPPYGTPPTSPDQRPEAAPPQQMPPDTQAPAPRPLSSAEVQDQIQKQLDGDPALDGTAVKASVDESTVVLSGTVETERQHALALRIADSYAGGRRIRDKITVRGTV
jgi:hypothetical protein